jgi:hypothetical protein
MDSRTFETTALNPHAFVVQDHLANNNLEEIDNEVADDLAATAALLSHRLTIEWGKESSQ